MRFRYFRVHEMRLPVTRNLLFTRPWQRLGVLLIVLGLLTGCGSRRSADSGSRRPVSNPAGIDMDGGIDAAPAMAESPMDSEAVDTAMPTMVEDAPAITEPEPMPDLALATDAAPPGVAAAPAEVPMDAPAAAPAPAAADGAAMAAQAEAGAGGPAGENAGGSASDVTAKKGTMEYAIYKTIEMAKNGEYIDVEAVISPRAKGLAASIREGGMNAAKIESLKTSFDGLEMVSRKPIGGGVQYTFKNRRHLVMVTVGRDSNRPDYVVKDITLRDIQR